MHLIAEVQKKEKCTQKKNGQSIWNKEHILKSTQHMCWQGQREAGTLSLSSSEHKWVPWLQTVIHGFSSVSQNINLLLTHQIIPTTLWPKGEFLWPYHKVLGKCLLNIKKYILSFHCKRKANLNTDDWINVLFSVLQCQAASICSLNSKSGQVVIGSSCEVKTPSAGSLF